jgi:hypothetical protein
MSQLNTSKAANRRASIRKPARRTIRLQCRRGVLGLGPNLGSAYVNVSETGVQVVTNVPLTAGGEVEIVFDGFGMRNSLKRAGQVVWVSSVEGGACRAGIHFVKPLAFREVQSISAP